MRTTERFEIAIIKLYNAFHKNELNAGLCSACAVGTLCNNTSLWTYYRKDLGEFISKKVDIKFYEYAINQSGYTPEELIEIEKIFLNAMDIYSFKFMSLVKEIKELQFKGLCAVIEFLCKLDGIPNVMDYQELFKENAILPVELQEK